MFSCVKCRDVYMLMVVACLYVYAIIKLYISAKYQSKG